MSGERKVTEALAVSGQIDAAEVAAAARRGVRLIVNNRPDGEETGQPTAAALAAAADDAGVGYLHLPVRGMPTSEQAQRMQAAVTAAGGPVLAFCRSGMRSVFTWAVGEQMAGGHSRDELLDLARRAGYDLDAYLPR